MTINQNPVALITGGARRLGQIITTTLHQAQYRVVIHYHQSKKEAHTLKDSLNKVRPDSASTIHADLEAFESLKPLITQTQAVYGRLDAIINNASTFFPTLVGKTSATDWDRLMGPNLKAPYFLAQAAVPYLREQKGCIINITDIHGQKPLKDFPVYSIAKAGLIMLTQSLAKELAPDIRVNAIAPGITIPSESMLQDHALTDTLKNKTLLKHFALPEEIANTVIFLMQQTSITGQTINVDCGRSIRQ